MSSAQTEVPVLHPGPKFAWSAMATTKFRAPWPRRGIVERAGLVGRLRSLAMEKRVTLVCAPAGSGKSTLLAQFAANCAPAELVWISLDDDDSDANRFFASLVSALERVALEWEVAPHVLASQVLGAGGQSRNAIALLANALSSYEGERLIVVLDDLHRVSDAGTLQLLNYLIEKLPPEISLLIGTRVAPELSFARWRSRGELGELVMADLQFDEQEAYALAESRLTEATPELVRQALKRTQGWVAGLQLLLGADAQADHLPRGGADRHTFDFLAHEVLAELPRQLREFAERCSVLPELSPALCNAVTQRADAAQLLEELYRRYLFITVVDEVAPVLRFHDLFREFLQRELERRLAPDAVRELHALAAQAETVSTRAVSHWLKAEKWEAAVETIAGCAEPLISEGGHSVVTRWIRQLPPVQQSGRPEIIRLRSLCAWSVYDYHTGRMQLERACELYRAQGNHEGLARSLPVLARMYNSVGDLETCARLVDECETLALDRRARATLDAVRVWLSLSNGRLDEVVRCLRQIAEAARAEPAALFPAISDLFNSFLYGVPGALAVVREIRAACVDFERVEPSHWQVGALAHSGWPELWHGDYSLATAALADQQQFRQRYSAITALRPDMIQFHACYLIASGRPREALELAESNVNLIGSSDLVALRASWLRPTLVDLGRAAWAAGDVTVLENVCRQLTPPRTSAEWPVIDVGRALNAGRLALLHGKLQDAERLLAEACRLFERWRLTSFMNDPRASLAILHVEQGREAEAWSTFAPLWREAQAEDALGSLLMEPPEKLARVLATMPADCRSEPASQALLSRLASWSQAPARAQAVTRQTVRVLGRLSQREYEVLERIAAGDSNKLIARTLDLSPHTVKRHVANILDKLNVPTRSGAATMFQKQN